MKKLLTILTLGITSLGYSQYCTTGGPSSTADSDLGDVVLNGNTTNINIPASCLGFTGLEDLTASQTADLSANSSYSISVDFNTCGGNFTNAGEVWIDYNVNNTFDTNESIGTWSGTAPSGVQTYNFTVPSWVCNGNTRIRIMQQESGSSPLDPCASYTWGSMIDATVTLSGGTCQVAGCIDPMALNFNPLATIDDGTCLPAAGKNCDTAHVITSLPFNQTGMTTNMYGSNYSSADACGSDYMDGNDFVFEYTATSTECLNVAISNANFSSGVFLLDGCPDAGSTCLAQDVGNNNLNVTATINAGTYYIVVSTDPSFGGPQFTNFDIDVISTTAGAAGSTCASPNTISSLPFNQTGLTTSCFGNDYNSSQACGSDYMDGDDYVFEYTATSTECITVDVTSTEFSTGVFILDGCPDAGATCLAEGTNNINLSVNTVVNAGTYYIVVSTDPSFGGPQSTNFDINIATTAGGAAGSTCANPHTITGNFNQTGLTTSCFGNDYNSTMACNSVNMNGDDYVFEYIPTNDTCVTISLANADFSTGLFLLDGCPDVGGTTCVGSSIGQTAQIFKASVMAGQSYYIVVSTDGTPSSTTFDFNLQELDCPVPNIQDCGGAIPLCFGATYESPNGVSYQGIGDVQYEFSTGNTCFGTGSGQPQGEPEVNSVWYTFTVPSTGDVNFTITPNDPSIDYDWAVFDVTAPNHSCQTLHADGAVACNWSGSPGPTGANNLGGAQNELPFSVQSGNSYVLVVTDFAASSVGFEIDFSKSTANIFGDNIDTEDQEICWGDAAELKATYVGPVFGEQTFSWSPASLVVDTTLKTTSSIPLFQDTTYFTANFASGQCVFSDTVLVTTVQFENEFEVNYDSIYSPVIVEFTNNSPLDVESYSWDFANGNTFDERDPENQSYTEPADYEVMLITESLTKDGYACLDSSIQIVHVPEYYIPNVITPNGDGFNDFLIIRGLKENTNLTVFNRWGKVVAEVFGYDNKWNGGNLADGQYHYIVTEQDGTIVGDYKGWFTIAR